MQKNPYHFNKHLMGDVESFCCPLYEKGITHFAFIRFYQNQTLRIGDREDWLNTFYQRDYYNDQLIFQKEIDALDFGEEKFAFLTNAPRNDHEKNLIEHGMWHFILKFKRYKNYVDFWCYAGHRGHPEIVNFYINNMDFLEEFATKFKDTLFSSSIKKKNMIKSSLIIPERDAKGRVLIRDQGQDKVIHLSPKLIKCVGLACRGLTIKMIAKEMNISPKTVEDHLTAIKSKTGIKYKTELCQKIIKIKGI